MWGMVILLGWIPVALRLLGAGYLITIMAVDVLIIFFSVRLIRTDNVSTQRQSMRGIYIGATLIVLAFVLGQVTG
jgi:hypothetical protein